MELVSEEVFCLWILGEFGILGLVIKVEFFLFNDMIWLFVDGEDFDEELFGVVLGVIVVSFEKSFEVEGFVY